MLPRPNPLQPWKTLSSRPVYQNNWISVREDIAQLPNGSTTLYGVVSMQGAVGVLPFVSDHEVLLVRQYRYPHGENLRWEIPTGGMHVDETPEDAARRELREESGYDPAALVLLSIMHPSNSVCDQTAWLFAARELSPSPLPPDATEDLEVGVFSFNEVLKMVRTSEIRDSLTVVAVMAEALNRKA